VDPKDIRVFDPDLYKRDAPFEEGQNFMADLHRVRFPGKVLARLRIRRISLGSGSNF
jgi:hypothetical protein